MKKVSIIIPVFNEKDTIKNILTAVEEAPFYNLEKEIILVDDYSTDGTREILKKYESTHRVIYHKKNSGKGAAVRTGFKYATGDFCAVQDADLEYNPKDYDKILKVLVEDEADVVYGSRFLLKENNDKFLFKSYIANRFLTILTNILFGVKITDMETCYKAFKTNFVKSITIESDRFNFEPEITAKAVKAKLRIKEVPIIYNGRNYDGGKKVKFKDAISAVITLLKYKLI